MKLWIHERPLKTLSGFTPRLASWNAKTDPAQIRLRAYLEEIRTQLGPLPDAPLGLHLEVDVEYESRLTHHYDLENYLTPLVGFLGRERFQLATAHKKVGGGSALTVGTLALRQDLPAWRTTELTLSCSPSSVDFKAELRQHLTAFPALPPGQVEVVLAWCGAPKRNWVSLWKPTGDAMGPLLGEPMKNRPYYPNDDRIVSLEHHWFPEPSANREITVRLWWRSVGAADVVAPVAAALPPVPRSKATIIQGILEVACKLGADQQAVSLAELHTAYKNAFPERAGQSEGSFSATLNYHCVNMQSRFPKPKEPAAPAAWMSRPLFKRVSRGFYQLLSERELDWFRQALAEGQELVYQPEYRVP